MNPQEIEALLKAAFPSAAEIIAKGDGSHYGVIVVSDELAALSKVKQQQAVYAPLTDCFASNAIHALTIKVFSTEKWKTERLLNL